MAATGNNKKPEWLDSIPDLTRVDFNAINSVNAVQAAQQQQMIHRDSEGGMSPEGQAAMNTPVQPSTLLPSHMDPTIIAEIQRAQELDAQLAGEQTVTPPAAGVESTSITATVPATTTPPAAAGAPTQQAAAPEVTQAADGTFRVTLPNGTYIDIDQAQAQQLVLNQQWLSSRPQEVIQQWAAIEQGTAAAVSREELTRLQALATQQQTPQQPVRPDLSVADPDVVAYVQRLEAIAQQQQPRVDNAPQVQGLPQFAQPGQPPAAFSQGAPQGASAGFQSQVNVDAEITRRQQLETANNWATAQWNLTPQQLEALQSATVQSNLIPQLIMRHRNVSPTGVVLSEPPFGDVVAAAYQQVIATDPTLRPVYEEHVYQQRLARDQSSNTTVQGKKALAGSLASAAPTAIPAAPFNPTSASQMDTREAIAAFLSPLMADGTASN